MSAASKREYKRAWRAKNRERLNAQRRATRSKDLERFRNYQRKWQAKNRQKVRAAHRKWWHNGGKLKHEEARLQRKYGIGAAERAALFQSQNGKCAICDASLTLSTSQIDHDHATRTVRGLLCGACNRGIGLFNDDPQRLLNAGAYLKRWKEH